MPGQEQHLQASLGFGDEAWAEAASKSSTQELSRGPVEPATPTAELSQLGCELPDSIVLGTSTWSFTGWHELVYAERYTSSLLARSGLGAYASHPLLRGVGLDRTYYRPLTSQQANDLSNQVPDSFRFMVKAPRDLTTEYAGNQNEQPACAPLDADWATEKVVAPLLEGMGEKLGSLVFQFQPHRRGAFGGPQAFCARLHEFLAALPEGPLYAVEIRNRDWLIPDYVQALCSAASVHCLSVHPRLPTLHEQIRMAGPAIKDGVVLRWNLGHGQAYENAYNRYHPFDRIVDPDLLNRDHIARLCARAARAGKLCQISVNNKAEGSAPASIEALSNQIVENLNHAVDD